MTDQERDVQRKLKVLRHAEHTGNIAKTCRYFGIGRASFYRWKTEYQQRGEAGLVNAKPIPKNPANQNSARNRGENPLFASQIPPRTNPHCLVSSTLSRHQNLCFAVLTLSVSVVSFPMLLDRPIDPEALDVGIEHPVVTPTISSVHRHSNVPQGRAREPLHYGALGINRCRVLGVFCRFRGRGARSRAFDLASLPQGRRTDRPGVKAGRTCNQAVMSGILFIAY